MKPEIVVIDGQGGRVGSALIEAVHKKYPGIRITAIGTNSIATSNMLKSGATEAATGENPVVVVCRKADVILGPIGITVADALLGEVTPKMACAVGSSDAVKILIPVNRCKNLVAGVPELSLGELIAKAVELFDQTVKLEK